MNKIDLVKIVPRRINTKFTNKSYSLNLAYSGEYILISRRKIKGSDGYIEKRIRIPKNYFCVWYKWPCGKNQNSDENNGVRFNYLILPRYIPLDELTLVSLGLLEAEMEVSVPNSSQISFTNCEPNLINLIIKFFERIGIKPTCWKWYIAFNFKLLNLESYQTTKMREELAKNFWMKNTFISPFMKIKKVFIYTGNRRNLNFDPDTIRRGTLKISYYNIILRKIILELLKEIKKTILKRKDKTMVKNYIRGIIAGEGSVKLSKSGAIDSVAIGSMNSFNKRFFRKCLKILGIKPSKDQKNCCGINNKENFFKIYKLGLFDLNKTRYRKFLIGLSRFRRFLKMETEIERRFMLIKKEIINKIIELEPEIIERDRLFGETSGIYSMAGERKGRNRVFIRR